MKAIRVAVDAMGGDHAPGVAVDGCVAAARRSPDVQVMLFGPENVLAPLVSQADPPANLSVHHAPQVIDMAESPAVAVKGKPDSSICRGLGAVAHGHADAFISAGNTGACMAGSLFILGRLTGISRPAILGVYPTIKGRCMLLDAGSNMDCKPEHLLQFAHMGSVYSERVLKVEKPTVALMNVGEEPGKGNEQVKAAFDLLQDSGLNFVGNIEGRDIMAHAADVVVCDGFVGNVMLKLGESIATVLPRMLAEEMTRHGMSQEEQQTAARALSLLARRFDYEEYGGVPLLGVKGSVILGHGGSKAKAFENMVLVAVEAARQDVPGSISASLAS